MTQSYRRHVIEEALRLYPAGWLLTRRARRDDKLGDYFVPATYRNLCVAVHHAATAGYLA